MMSGKRLAAWALYAVLGLCINAARAEMIADLYSVSVPVAEQSQAELQRAAALGLRELAVRISGRSSAASDPALNSVFANALRYLDQYRYERNAGGNSPLLAQLRFGATQIDHALRGAGLPQWGANRPALQTWLVVDDGKSRHFVDDDDPIAAALRDQLRRRGLQLHFPANFSAVSMDDAWSLDTTKVRAAARADGYLIGRIAQTSDGYQGAWVLDANGQLLNAEGQADTLPAYFAQTLDRIVDNFSPQYALAANAAAEGIVLRITGIGSFDDYAAVLNYLRHLAAIKNAIPMLLRSDELLLQLKIEGSAEQLTRQFALESRLAVTENSPAQNTLPVALNYRWGAARN